jgi:WD40 repeat protein
VWSIPDRRQIARLTIDEDITVMGFSPSAKLLALSHYSGAVQLWDTKTWKRQAVLGVLGSEDETAWGMAFSRDGKSLAVGYYDHKVRVWDLATRQARVFGTLPNFPEHLSFSPGARFLAAADFTGHIKVWEVASGEEHWSFRAHTDPETKRVGVQGLAFHPDGSTLVTAGTDGMVRVWNVPSKKDLRHFDGKVGEVNAMALAPDGKLVAVAGGTVWMPDKPGGVRIFDVSTGHQVAERGSLDHGVACICFAQDSKGLVVGTYGPPAQIFFWTVADLIEKEKGVTGSPR